MLLMNLSDRVGQSGSVVLRSSSDGTGLPARGAARSRRVHSRYARQLRDLPCIIGHVLRLVLTVRRFRYEASGCPQRFFTERLEAFARPYARMTERLRGLVARVAHSLGSPPGARAWAHAGDPAEWNDADPRLLEKSAEPVVSPRVIGLDEWAWRRGHCYGTAIFDLERQRLCGLLPDRTRPRRRSGCAASPYRPSWPQPRPRHAAAIMNINNIGAEPNFGDN